VNNNAGSLAAMAGEPVAFFRQSGAKAPFNRLAGRIEGGWEAATMWDSLFV
jgi:hypothetical protein